MASSSTTTAQAQALAKTSYKTPMASSSTTTAQTSNTSPIYFWREYGTPHCYLSQWYSSPFTCPTTKTHYKTAEQYMMHQKALLFNDPVIAAKILQMTSPKEQKSLGRKVKNFDQKVWEAEREKIVEEGSYVKFKYGKDCGELNEGEGERVSLRERLLRTGQRDLVEASPMDRIWGIGFTAKWAEERRGEWGLNLLGKALMKARERLRAEEAGEGNQAPGDKGEEKKVVKAEVVDGKEPEKKEAEAEVEEERPKKRARKNRKA